MNITKKLSSFLVIALMIVPQFLLAQAGGAEIFYDEQVVFTESNGEMMTTGTLMVSGLSNPGSLQVIMLIDSDSDFDPPDSIVDLGTPPANGPINFSIGGAPVGTYFIPVIVDDASFIGSFSLNDGGNFQTFIAGQVAQSAPEVIAPPGGGPGDNPAASTAGAANTLVFTDFSRIQNPLGEDWNAWQFLHKLFSNFVKIALPFMIVFMVYSGFLFVEARGNAEKLSKARKNFMYVIIGALLILSAWTIALMLKGTVQQFEAYNHLFTNLKFFL